ncbi:MAG: outer membrane protein assembly factor BamD [Calditrichae bacterium]|nr:outer membrane protein assembly factor BamD [Calditrichia bacterium]
MTKYFFVLLLTTLIWLGCSGRNPEPGWKAEEYFRYAQELYDDEDYYGCANEFTIIILRYAGSSVADSAQFFLGMSHYQLEEFIISAAEFSKLINNMPQSPLVPDAQYMLGMSYYEMSPRAALDQEYTKKALRAFQLFIEDFPRHTRREDVEKQLLELREKLAQKEFLNAELYRKMFRLRSSLIYYDIVLERYYDTSWVDDALLGKALVYIDLEDWANAREQLLIFKDKFPDSDLNYAVERSLRKVSSNIDD